MSPIAVVNDRMSEPAVDQLDRCASSNEWAVHEWAVQDLNLRPLARHAHIPCSPPLSDVQISPNRSTFCPLKFVADRLNFFALLTALLTECLRTLCKGLSKTPYMITGATWIIRPLLTALLTLRN
jgi:hypothetical protein